MKKTLDTYEVKGFGFPIVLKHVPAMEYQGELMPDIDYNALQQVVALMLAVKPARLTGNNVRFLRQFMGLTLAAFGEMLDAKHTAVMKWEKHAQSATQMHWATEKDLRLRIMQHLGIKDAAFRKVYESLGKKVEDSTKRVTPQVTSRQLKVDINKQIQELLARPQDYFAKETQARC